MKPFRTNLKLVINIYIYMFVVKATLPGADSSCNYFILVGISNDFLYCHCEIIASEIILVYFLKHGVK